MLDDVAWLAKRETGAHPMPKVCKSPEMVETRFSPPRGALDSASVGGSIVSDVSRICEPEGRRVVSSSFLLQGEL
jgi:hypothetical protein